MDVNEFCCEEFALCSFTQSICEEKSAENGQQKIPNATMLGGDILSGTNRLKMCSAVTLKNSFDTESEDGGNGTNLQAQASSANTFEWRNGDDL